MREVHSAVKNHVCNICSKAFSRPDKLRSHQQTHNKPDAPTAASQWPRFTNADAVDPFAVPLVEPEVEPEVEVGRVEDSGDEEPDEIVVEPPTDFLNYYEQEDEDSEAEEQENYQEPPNPLILQPSKTLSVRPFAQLAKVPPAAAQTFPLPLPPPPAGGGGDWSQTCELTCTLCVNAGGGVTPGGVLVGVQASVDHMRLIHPEHVSGDKRNVCAFCLHAFQRRDHLKKHIHSHVKAQAKPVALSSDKSPHPPAKNAK